MCMLVQDEMNSLCVYERKGLQRGREQPDHSGKGFFLLVCMVSHHASFLLFIFAVLSSTVSEEAFLTSSLTSQRKRREESLTDHRFTLNVEIEIVFIWSFVFRTLKHCCARISDVGWTSGWNRFCNHDGRDFVLSNRVTVSIPLWRRKFSPTETNCPARYEWDGFLQFFGSCLQIWM